MTNFLMGKRFWDCGRWEWKPSRVAW
jgi:hypothetical protein